MPAVDLRQALGGWISFEGVRNTGDLAVTQRAAGANMSVDVAPGSAYIADDHAGGGGFYSATLGSVTNVTVGTADPTNPRIDRVILRVRDQALGDAANDTTPVVVAGTPTAAATLNNQNGIAALPGSSLLLANILVPAGSSSVTNANIDTTGASNNTFRVRGLVNEANYTESTLNQTSVSTTAAAAAIVATALPLTLDGNTTVNVEYYSPLITHTVASTTVLIDIWDGSTDLGVIAELTVGPTAGFYVKAAARLTPSAATHTYTARMWSTAAGTATASTGAGGAGVVRAAYIRVARA